MRIARRIGTISSAVGTVAGARPVMLVTFDVPFAPEAAAFAVDSAVESGQPLIVVNAAEVPILPISMAMGYEYAGTDEVEESLRAPAELAHSLAVDVERLQALQPASGRRTARARRGAQPGAPRARTGPRTVAATALRKADEADQRAGSVPRMAAGVARGQPVSIAPRQPSAIETAAACSTSDVAAARVALLSNREAGPWTPMIPTSSP